ncbi:MAG TPA: hypothetical protein VNS58_18805 [Puia sp.]|nr:hypothetical protein [Puia sp.]
MSHFLKHSHFFDRPVWLTDKEQQDPFNVLQRFTDDYTLSELRNHLYEMVSTCITTDNPYFDYPEQRDHLLFFQVKVEMLLEAVYILIKQKNNE